MGTDPAAPRVPWVAVVVFAVASCALAWGVALPLWLADGLATPWAGLILPVMMATPAAAMLVVVFGMRVPPRGRRLRFLGMWPLRPVGRWVLFLLVAVFGPVLLVVASVAVAAGFGFLRLDLVEFSGFAAQLAASVPAGAALPPVGVLVVAQLLSIPLGALVNAIPAAGEELGWRGWLLPALRPLGVWPALLVSGAVWGIWHAPIILLGYNFARTDVTGVLLMVVGCIAWGVLLGWLRLRSRSVWPAVLAHGSLNAAAGLFALVAASDQRLDPALVSPLGVSGWIVIALTAAILALTGQFRRSRLEVPLPTAPAGN